MNSIGLSQNGVPFIIPDEPEAKSPLIVVIFWPEDDDRGLEVYGPFADEDAQMEWVEEVQATGDAGDALLSGASFLLTRMDAVIIPPQERADNSGYPDGPRDELSHTDLPGTGRTSGSEIRA